LDSLELVYQDEVLKLFWDREARYHISEWRCSASGEQLRTAAHACLTASRERPSSLWLADLTAFTAIDSPDLQWIASEYYPLLARNGVRRLVYVLPEPPQPRASLRQMPTACGHGVTIEFEYCDSREAAIRRLESLPR
jgi:hypothetical protein